MRAAGLRVESSWALALSGAILVAAGATRGEPMARTDVHHLKGLELDVAAWSKSLAAVIVVAVIAGCSSDEGAGAEDGTGGSAAAGGAGGAGATFTGLAQPCENFDTGYPGDEFCIKPPPAGEGTQVHY